MAQNSIFPLIFYVFVDKPVQPEAPLAPLAPLAAVAYTLYCVRNVTLVARTEATLVVIAKR